VGFATLSPLALSLSAPPKSNGGIDHKIRDLNWLAMVLGGITVYAIIFIA